MLSVLSWVWDKDTIPSRDSGGRVSYVSLVIARFSPPTWSLWHRSGDWIFSLSRACEGQKASFSISSPSSKFTIFFVLFITDFFDKCHRKQEESSPLSWSFVSNREKCDDDFSSPALSGWLYLESAEKKDLK